MRVAATCIVCLACAFGATASGGASTAPGLIVYWSESPWPTIWAARADGTHVHRVLRNHQNAKRPRLSPHRKWIAFDGTPPGKPPLTEFDIQIVRVDGTGLRTLTHTSDWDHDPQWSPSGTQLSFSRLPPHHQDELGSTIWIMRRDGSGLRQVVSGYGPRWSPDGKSLVYGSTNEASHGDLYVVGVDGNDQHVLVDSTTFQQPAAWSPDGRILFTRYADSGHASVYVVNGDGTGLRRVGPGIAACWSPDGRILFSRTFEGPLYVMNPDGSHRRKIVDRAAADADWR
jgi:Tol biopolymer transport system component